MISNVLGEINKIFYIRKEILRIKSNKYRGIIINRNWIDRRFKKVRSKSLERNLYFSMVNSLFLLVKFVFTFCFCLIAVWQTEREPRMPSRGDIRRRFRVFPGSEGCWGWRPKGRRGLQVGWNRFFFCHRRKSEYYFPNFITRWRQINHLRIILLFPSAFSLHNFC